MVESLMDDTLIRCRFCDWWGLQEEYVAHLNKTHYRCFACGEVVQREDIKAHEDGCQKFQELTRDFRR